MEEPSLFYLTFPLPLTPLTIMFCWQHSTALVSLEVLSWFKSYLTDRKQTVRIGNPGWRERKLLYGVPQGSVLGPQLFSLYTYPLQHIIEDSGVSFHLYADDTQLYLAFDPNSSSSLSDTKEIISKCVTNIDSWMKTNFLKLNSDKTELLVITSPFIKNTEVLLSMDICSCNVSAVGCVRDLGVYFDSELKMEHHVKSLCKKAYIQLHLIAKVRKNITEDTTRTLVQTNVTPIMD